MKGQSLTFYLAEKRKFFCVTLFTLKKFKIENNYRHTYQLETSIQTVTTPL